MSGGGAGRATPAFPRVRQGTEQQRPGMARATGGELVAGDWKGSPVCLSAGPPRPRSAVVHIQSEKTTMYDWSIFYTDARIKFGIEKDGFLLHYPMP